jgi:P pilus assembly chaperone PapD
MLVLPRGIICYDLKQGVFMKFARFFLGAVLIPLFTAAPAHANLSLDKVILEFKQGGRPVDNITVRNDGDEPVKVSVSALEDLTPGQHPEKLEPAKNLIAAPKAFELAAGETRVVRVVLRKWPEDMEGIYRVRFMPDRVTMEKKVETTSNKTINIGVTVTMGALVMVPPKNPRPDLVATRGAKTVHFKNKGNVTAQLQREDFCADDDKKACGSLPGMRIYPGMSWDMDIPDALKKTDFEQTVLMNGNYTKISYPLKKGVSDKQ